MVVFTNVKIIRFKIAFFKPALIAFFLTIFVKSTFHFLIAVDFE